MQPHEAALVSTYVDNKLTGMCVYLAVTLYELDRKLGVQSTIVSGYLYCPDIDDKLVVRHVWVERRGQIIDLSLIVLDALETPVGRTSHHTVVPKGLTCYWEPNSEDGWDFDEETFDAVIQLAMIEDKSEFWKNADCKTKLIRTMLLGMIVL